MSRSASNAVQVEVRQAYRAETDELFRRRLRWWIGVSIALSLPGTILELVLNVLGYTTLPLSPQSARVWGMLSRVTDGNLSIVAYWGASVMIFAAYCWVWFWNQRRAPSSRRVTHMVWAVLAASLVAYMPVQFALRNEQGFAFGLLLAGPTAHFFACCFFPWAIRTAAVPMLWVIPFTLGVVGALKPDFPLQAARAVWGTDARWVGFVVIGAASALCFVPGVVVSSVRAAARAARFRMRYLESRYVGVRNELVDVRGLHESIFPPAFVEGPGYRLSYVYRPQADLGGDFLFVDQARPDAPLYAVLVDVTGHGVAAAIVVARLHGEIRRILSARPGLAPHELLNDLNTYMLATTSGRSMYATAIAVQVTAETRGRVRVLYASAGHPPAFVLRTDGAREPLASTAFVLGVAPDLGTEQLDRTLEPGDALLLYTDGLIESRDRRAEMPGIRGLEDLLRDRRADREPDKLPERLAEWERRRRAGPVGDDILIAVLVAGMHHERAEPRA
ncbi:MAG: PP2C family protein-serine/threonine phosphatase [Planctomycetota bacterium]|nr:PP2C family protein-serine/threonine phosphatase [Planctomycetota bacterium]